MKNPAQHHGTNPLSRREMLKGAAAGIGVGIAMLPAARLLAAAATKSTLAPVVAMGYWQHARNVDLNKADDILADAATVAPEAASYRLRVLSAISNTAFSIDAEYMSSAAHRFWQAWSEGGLLQHSNTGSIVWWAQNKRALPLTIRTAGGASLTQVPAKIGTYVLAIGPNAQPLPAWSNLAIRATNPKNPRTLQLLARGNSQRVAFPYLVFRVEQVV